MTELLILDGDTETLLSAIMLIVDKHQDLSAAACSPRRKAQPYILLPLGSDSQLALLSRNDSSFGCACTCKCVICVSMRECML